MKKKETKKNKGRKEERSEYINKQNVSKRTKPKDKNERERRRDRWHGERTYVLKEGSVKRGGGGGGNKKWEVGMCGGM